MMQDYQVMGEYSRATFGVYKAETPEEALDQWAAAYKWGTWKDAQEKCADLFKGFRLVDGFRLLI